MSSQPPRAAHHQDFIARIRYSNALPPPPLPPKLLEMAGSGLAGDQYTNPGFAARLVREQPLNIEADAELGMPLDLVGIPGIFEGDESAIQAPATQPPIHPHDRLLLRPLASLNRPAATASGVSFLRRTEYISSMTPKRAMGSSPRMLIHKAARHASQAVASKRSSAAAAALSAGELEKDSPAAIRRRIDDGFAATARILAADPATRARTLHHPNLKKRGRQNVRLVEALPLLPDLDAFPDSGAFVVVKFATAPILGSTTHDPRLSMSLLRPIQFTPEEEAAHAAAVEAWNLDPQDRPQPEFPPDYEFFLGATPRDAQNLRAKLSADHPDRHDDGLYTFAPSGGDAGANGGDAPCFRMSRLRAYETAGETESRPETKYDSEVLIAVSGGDGNSSNGAVTAPTGRTAFFYPVSQRTAVRPQRAKNILRRTGLVNVDAERVSLDAVDVTVADPDPRLQEQMDWFRDHPREAAVVRDADEPKRGEAGEREDDEEDDDARAGRSRSREPQPESDGEEREVLDEDEDHEDGAGGGRARRQEYNRRKNDEDRDNDDEEDDEEDVQVAPGRARRRLSSASASDDE